jgi:hypothetical protein
MRVSTSATHRLAVGQSRVAARAVAAALELASPPEIALVPAVPLVLQLSERARIGATLEAATVITTRAARVTTQRAAFLNQDLWPRLRG